MGRDDEIGQFQQRAVWRQRFDMRHIDGRATDALLLQSRDKCLFVNNIATRCIDENSVHFHHGEFLFADEMERVIRQRAVEGDVVGFFQKFFQRNGLDIHVAHGLLIRERIEAEDAHAEASHHFHDATCDAPEADETERPSADMPPHIA